jgi:hypothetical protein
MTGQRSGVAFEGQALRTSRESSAPFKFGRHNITIDHPQDPFDLGAARGMLVSEFVPHAELEA